MPGGFRSLQGYRPLLDADQNDEIMYQLHSTISLGKSDKDRIFLAVYGPLDGAIVANQDRVPTEPSFCCGILIESKDRSDATSYEVKVSGFPGSDHWHYHHEKIRPEECASLLGMLMIGKSPNGVSQKRIGDFLEKVKLPDVNSTFEGCQSWTKNAIEELQERKYVERFDMAELMQVAYDKGKAWEAAARKNQRTTFVKRKFP